MSYTHLSIIERSQLDILNRQGWTVRAITATTDRGKEFSCYSSLEVTHNIDVYFADPYSSWQRGSNENGNGLLREFFPKGKDFAEVTDDELIAALNLINNRPRKCLGWKTAHESFTDALSHLA